MIGSVRGVVLEGGVVETSGGVGYCVATVEPLVVGSEVFLWVVTTVRETAIELWGFSSVVERDVFLALCKVKGVGAALALRVLRELSVGELVGAVSGGDVKVFRRVSGVGARLAQQLVLDLKLPDHVVAGVSSVSVGVDRGAAVQALVGLGYPAGLVRDVVSEVLGSGKVSSVEDVISLSVQRLSAGV